MMRHFFSSLYWKIAAVLVLLVVVIGVSYGSFMLFAVEMYAEEATQKVSAPLAGRLVEKVIMIRDGEVDEAAAEEVFVNAAMLNPGVEIYLLDPAGAIMASSVGSDEIVRDAVDLEPVAEFMQTEGGAFVTGDDPKHADGEKVFSAAPMVVDGELQGYVYAILRGAEYDSAAQMLQDSYILLYGWRLALVALLAAAALGLVLLWLLLRKLRRIQEGVQAFGRGELDTQIPVTAEDELDDLAAAFNQMAEATRRNLEEIRKTDALRRELVANVSHDLRTPLASIRGYVETLLIKGDELTEGERLDYLRTALHGTQKLSRLVDQLFELSKLDARQREPVPEAFSASDLVHDVFQKASPRAEAANVALEVEVAPSMPQAYADVGMIDRALQNLLDNALQHAPPGSTVRAMVAERDGVVVVKVEDEGPGISSQDLPHVFDRFYRSDKSRGREDGGAGLGLAIVQKIVEANRGGIEVESEVGKGTSFVMTIPRHFRAVDAPVVGA